jgi:hypothetical protein
LRGERQGGRERGQRRLRGRGRRGGSDEIARSGGYQMGGGVMDDEKGKPDTQGLAFVVIGRYGDHSWS